MMKYLVFFVFVLIFEVHSSPATWYTRPTTPRSTTLLTTRLTTPSKSKPPTPVFISNNYIPAAMHVLFHLSDLMKYDSKPSSTPAPSPGGVPSEPTSTTFRPTQPHKPGNYAPDKIEAERGSQTSLAWSFGWGKIVGGLPDITPSPLQSVSQEPLPVDIDLFGAAPSELLHQINTLEDIDTIGDEDVLVEKFSINYDDTVNLDFLRQKKAPPTRAFVTVLSLFDVLNKESKELGLNKFNGYSESMLQELQKTSEGSSSEQLKFVLSKIIDKRNTRKDSILKKIKQMLIDLEKPESYINMAIKFLPPLQFSA